MPPLPTTFGTKRSLSEHNSSEEISILLCFYLTTQALYSTIDCTTPHSMTFLAHQSFPDLPSASILNHSSLSYVFLTCSPKLKMSSSQITSLVFTWTCTRLLLLSLLLFRERLGAYRSFVEPLRVQLSGLRRVPSSGWLRPYCIHLLTRRPPVSRKTPCKLSTSPLFF